MGNTLQTGMRRKSMNCTVCGKPHSKEQPLTVIEDMVPIGQVIAFCPGCLKERNEQFRGSASNITVKITVDEQTQNTINRLRDQLTIKKASQITGLDMTPMPNYGGYVKIGKLELPVTRLELR